VRSLAAAEMGDCPYGVGDAKQYDCASTAARHQSAAWPSVSTASPSAHAAEFGARSNRMLAANGKLLRRGDHILRRGGGISAQHAIYVGEAGGRTLIYYQRIGDGSSHRRAVFSRLSYATFDEFVAAGEVYRIEYGVHDGAETCLHRAHARLGDTGCDLYALRGAAWATWCKTGTLSRVPPPERLFSQRSLVQKVDGVVNIVTRVVDGVAVTARIVTGIALAGRVANMSRGVGVAAASARTAAAVGAVGGAFAGLGGTMAGVLVVNLVLRDDAKLPQTERHSRAAARITGSVAATTAALGSGIAATVAAEGIGVLAGGAVAGGVAVAAAIPMAAALVLGFSAYGISRGIARTREAKAALLMRILATRTHAFTSDGSLSALRDVLLGHLAYGPYPTPGYAKERKRLQALLTHAASPSPDGPPRVHATAAVSLLDGSARVTLTLALATPSLPPPSLPPPSLPPPLPNRHRTYHRREAARPDATAVEATVLPARLRYQVCR